MQHSCKNFLVESSTTQVSLKLWTVRGVCGNSDLVDTESSDASDSGLLVVNLKQIRKVRKIVDFKHFFRRWKDFTKDKRHEKDCLPCRFTVHWHRQCNAQSIQSTIISCDFISEQVCQQSHPGPSFLNNTLNLPAVDASLFCWKKKKNQTAHLRWELRLLFTWPRPLHPGVGHLRNNKQRHEVSVTLTREEKTSVNDFSWANNVRHRKTCVPVIWQSDELLWEIADKEKKKFTHLKTCSCIASTGNTREKLQ